jgi:hypothetical protein
MRNILGCILFVTIFFASLVEANTAKQRSIANYNVKSTPCRSSEVVLHTSAQAGTTMLAEYTFDNMGLTYIRAGGHNNAGRIYF